MVFAVFMKSVRSIAVFVKALRFSWKALWFSWKALWFSLKALWFSLKALQFSWKAPLFERPLARNCNPMFWILVALVFSIGCNLPLDGHPSMKYGVTFTRDVCNPGLIYGESIYKLSCYSNDFSWIWVLELF